MKVRIGLAAGSAVTRDAAAFLDLVDTLDDVGYDSIWIPDIITTRTLDPIAALSVAAGRRRRLKLGTHLIVPGRNPVLLAKQLASLDQLSDGRLLLMAVIGIREPAELAAQGVEAAERTRMLESSVEMMRALWRGDEVRVEGHDTPVSLAVTPKQDPLELWFGGQVPAALRRCGRLGEGWMPGLMTPEEAADARVVIEEAATAAGREIDGEHFGMNLSWVHGEIPDEVRANIARRRPDLDAEAVIGQGAEGLAERIDAFLDVGFSKFVVRPAVEPASWVDAAASVTDVLAMQT